MIMLIGIAITGMPGAGKSTLANAAKKLGIPVVSMGEIIFQETKKRGLSLTPENVGKVATELRKTFGDDIVAKLTIEHIREKILPQSPSSEKIFIAIDGVRSLAEINTFKKFFDRLIVIAVHAPPEIRYKRLLNRKRLDDPSEVEKLIKRDLRELSFGLGDVIALADEILINKDKSYNEFFNECIEFLKRLLKEENANCR